MQQGSIYDDLPIVKIVGSNRELKRFLVACAKENVPVSTANRFFREDHEHCLMPCYAYDKAQPTNIKLQLLAVDSFQADVVLTLPYDFNKAIELLMWVRNEVAFSAMTQEAPAQKKTNFQLHMEKLERNHKLN